MLSYTTSILLHVLTPSLLSFSYRIGLEVRLKTFHRARQPAHHLSLSTPVVHFAPAALLSLFLVNVSGQFPATHGGQKLSFEHPEYAPPAL